MRGFFMVPLLFVAGCTATETWTRADFASPAAMERQRSIDVGYCQQAAHGAVQMPSPPPASRPASYDIRGTYSRPGRLPGTFEGTATPQSGGFYGGFADGMAQGAATRQILDANRARDQIFDGCMAAKGWTRGAAPPAEPRASHARTPDNVDWSKVRVWQPGDDLRARR